MAKRTLRRQTPKVGARCGNTARRDLCGGRVVTRVPTAIGSREDVGGHGVSIRSASREIQFAFYSVVLSGPPCFLRVKNLADDPPPRSPRRKTKGEPVQSHAGAIRAIVLNARPTGATASYGEVIAVSTHRSVLGASGSLEFPAGRPARGIRHIARYIRPMARDSARLACVAAVDDSEHQLQQCVAIRLLVSGLSAASVSCLTRPTHSTRCSRFPTAPAQGISPTVRMKARRPARPAQSTGTATGRRVQ